MSAQLVHSPPRLPAALRTGRRDVRLNAAGRTVPMVDATRRGGAHLETVIEFELDPVGPPAPGRGERAMRARRTLGFSGAVLGVVLAAVVGTAVATSPARPSDSTVVQSSQAAAALPCRPVGALPPDRGKQGLWGCWSVPTSASAEVAMRAAGDAAVVRSRVWVQTHGPGSGGYRVWGFQDPQVQRMGSP